MTMNQVKMKVVRATMVMLALCASSATQATPIQFCIDISAAYVDSGNGEDYWTGSGWQWRDARGMLTRVYRNGSSVWYGYLGDGLGSGDPGKGCTPEIDVPAGTSSYSFDIWSRAWVNSNWVNVRDMDDNVPPLQEYGQFSVAGSNYSSGSQYPLSFAPAQAGASTDELWNVFAAATYAIYRHGGGMTHKSYSIKQGEHIDDEALPGLEGTRYQSSNGYIYISDNRAEDKFVIVHEMGHRLGDLGTNGQLIAGNCIMSVSQCPASSGGHSMTSKEYNTCAAVEGWGHFYAADVWNSHNQTNCFFKYYKGGDPLVDCEYGTSTYPTRYMENKCYYTNNYGMGVELDWLRTFWDMHTHSGSSVPFNDFLDWIGDASPWLSINAHSTLDAEANNILGVLNTRWDTYSSYNGIDH